MLTDVNDENAFFDVAALIGRQYFENTHTQTYTHILVLYIRQNKSC